MKMGDLVKHNRTQAVGLVVAAILTIETDSYMDTWYDVEWYDGLANPPSSHRDMELITLNENR